jgi:hypothetical protein
MAESPNIQSSPSAAIPVWGIDGPPINTPLGYQQIAVLTAAVGLTVPTGTTFATIRVSGAPVRYRDDGVAPTAALGYPLLVGDVLTYHVSLGTVRFIQQSATAVLDILYYK